MVGSVVGMDGAYQHEIVIVDDNSTDHTAEDAAAVARDEPRVKLVKRNPPGGVGRALRDGYAAASGKYILSIDCDFITIASEFKGLFDAVAEGYDGAIGSRFSSESALVRYPFLKILCNRGYHLLLNLLLGIAVAWLTLKVPTLLHGQVRHVGLSNVVSLVVLSRFVGGLGSGGGPRRSCLRPPDPPDKRGPRFRARRSDHDLGHVIDAQEADPKGSRGTLHLLLDSIQGEGEIRRCGVGRIEGGLRKRLPQVRHPPFGLHDHDLVVLHPHQVWVPRPDTDLRQDPVSLPAEERVGAINDLPLRAVACNH